MLKLRKITSNPEKKWICFQRSVGLRLSYVCSASRCIDVLKCIEHI